MVKTIENEELEQLDAAAMSAESFSTGSERYDPERIKAAFAEVERWSQQRIDLLVPSKQVRVSSTGQLFFSTSNVKLLRVGTRVFTDFRDAEAESDLIREATPDLPYNIEVIDGKDYNLQMTDRARSQLLARLGTPVRYANSLEKAGNSLVLWKHTQDLLDSRVNGSKYLFRILDGKVQSVLSSSYRPIDTVAMLRMILPKVQELGATVMHCQVFGGQFKLTVCHHDMMIKLADMFEGKSDHTFIDCPDGDPHFRTATVYNAEYGNGSAGISAGAWRRVCNNSCVSSEKYVEIRHIGSDLSSKISDASFLSAATRLKISDAEVSKITDGLAAAFDMERFSKYMKVLASAKEQSITQDAAVSACKAVIVSNNLPRGILDSMVANLLTSRDLTKFGLIQATTAVAHTSPDSVAAAVEQAGGRLAELRTNQKSLNTWIESGAKQFDNVKDVEAALA